MAIFRSLSKSQKQPEDPLAQREPQVDLPNEHFKVDTGAIHDPILKAVSEAQPFEEATAGHYERRPLYLLQDSGNLKDVFGNPIRTADMSNPTRNRNERPLDTVRGFEFAITGDMAYREQLESQQLGWGFHEDFPHANMMASENGHSQSFNNPIASFSGEQPMYQAGNYSALSLKNDKKKKKGLFGRRKKNDD